MKRNKIDGDFRSNVSLGASTQEIDLTDEQKEIILNTARVSGCRWVGVDLMDCEDGSQVVIEYNSSPGVQGISQQIKQNMFDIILDKITEYFKKNKWTDDKNTIHSVKNVTYFTEYNHDIIENLKDEWEILSEDRQKILNKCLEFHPGLHYTLHGKGPIYGFDCSGFVYWVVKDSLNIILPKMCVDYFTILQENNFEQIKRKDLKPGDIGVLNDSTKYNHCGIYAGQDKWFETNLAYGLQLSDFSKFKYFFRVKNIDN
jgi:signal peptidase I